MGEISPLKYSLLISLLTQYTISSTLIRTRLLSAILSIRIRNNRIDSNSNSNRQFRSLLITILETIISYSSIRSLLAPTSLPLFPIVSLGSTTLPILLPHLDQLYNFNFINQFFRLTTFSLLSSSLHQLSQSLMGARRRESGKKGGETGIELRGASLAVTTPLDSSTFPIEDQEELECSICLSTSSSTKPLEQFCKTCKTAMHRDCVIEWFHSVTDTTSTRIRQRGLAGIGSGITNRGVESGFTIITSPPGLISDEVSGRLMSLLVDHGLGGSIQLNIDSLGRITGSGGNRRESSEVVMPDEVGEKGCWGLGKLARITVEEKFGKEESNLSAVPGVEIFLDSNYVEQRTLRKQLWWWNLEPNTQIEIRNSLLSQSTNSFKESQKDPLIAKIISSLPRAGCPFCRNPIELFVYLTEPKLPTLMGEEKSIWKRFISKFVELNWKKHVRGIALKILAQGLMMVFIRIVGIARNRKVGN